MTKSKVLAFAGCAAGMLLLARVYEKPILAQVRAALVQNVDEPARNAFALSANSDGLNPRTQFDLPAGKKYVIEHYNGGCDVANTSSLTSIEVRLTTNGVTNTVDTVTHYQQYDGSISGSPVNFYRGTGDGPLYADGGTSVYMEFHYAGTSYPVKTCYSSISGHTVTP